MSRMSKLKIVSFVLTIILIPFLISLIASYTTWFGTKDKIEVSITLDGHITVGSIMESSIPELALTWNGEPINNLLKLSWRVENSGTKGIPSFEAWAFNNLSRGYPTRKLNNLIYVAQVEGE